MKNFCQHTARWSISNLAAVASVIAGSIIVLPLSVSAVSAQPSTSDPCEKYTKQILELQNSIAIYEKRLFTEEASLPGVKQVAAEAHGAYESGLSAYKGTFAFSGTDEGQALSKAAADADAAVARLERRINLTRRDLAEKRKKLTDLLNQPCPQKVSPLVPTFPFVFPLPGFLGLVASGGPTVDLGLQLGTGIGNAKVENASVDTKGLVGGAFAQLTFGNPSGIQPFLRAGFMATDISGTEEDDRIKINWLGYLNGGLSKTFSAPWLPNPQTFSVSAGPAWARETYNWGIPSESHIVSGFDIEVGWRTPLNQNFDIGLDVIYFNLAKTTFFDVVDAKQSGVIVTGSLIFKFNPQPAVGLPAR